MQTECDCDDKGDTKAGVDALKLIQIPEYAHEVLNRYRADAKLEMAQQPQKNQPAYRRQYNSNITELYNAITEKFAEHKESAHYNGLGDTHCLCKNHWLMEEPNDKETLVEALNDLHLRTEAQLDEEHKNAITSS